MVAVQQAGGMASVKSVQVRTSGATGGFQSLTNKWGSDWETPNAPAFPLDINIIGADGETVGCSAAGPCACRLARTRQVQQSLWC